MSKVILNCYNFIYLIINDFEHSSHMSLVLHGLLFVQDKITSNGTDWGSLSLRKKGNSWGQTQKKIMQGVNSPPAFLPQRSVQVLGAAKRCVCLNSKGRHTSSVTSPPYSSSLGVTLSVGNCGIQSSGFRWELFTVVWEWQRFILRDLGQIYGLVEQHDWVRDLKQKFLEHCSADPFSRQWTVLSTFCLKSSLLFTNIKLTLRSFLAICW